MPYVKGSGAKEVDQSIRIPVVRLSGPSKRVPTFP